MLQDLFRSRTTEAWLELLLSTKIPAGPINDIPTVLSDPQVLQRQMVQEVEHPTAGTFKVLGPVAKLSQTPAKIQSVTGTKKALRHIYDIIHAFDCLPPEMGVEMAYLRYNYGLTTTFSDHPTGAR